jgi:hypothetical protein
MATGSTADDGLVSRERLPSAREIGRAILTTLVSAPGRSTATLLVAVPYVWLGYYIVGAVLGRHGDVIVGGDWLTLLFTSYAFLSAIALAHRILHVGVAGLTVESLVDVVVLVWLTAFYFVWMLLREPVSTTTTVEELYGPILSEDPVAIVWLLTVVAVGSLATGIILFPRPGSRLFKTRFRTAFVTFPATATAVVLLFRPGGDSLTWPFVTGIFLGTLVGGSTRIHVIASAIAKGLFAALSLCVWTVGAIGWILVYRRRPPTDAVVLTDTVLKPDDERSKPDGEEKSK